MMVTAAGMGLTFVPLSLVSLTKVADHDAGVASSLLNVGQQLVAWASTSSLSAHACSSLVHWSARTVPATAGADGVEQASLAT